jgi:DNA topoisomerase-1
MNLIIVESPTKARTLTKFLSKDYTVEATMGHIKDLPKSTLGIDVEKNFKPEYIEVKGKTDAIGKLKKASKKADNIYIATDPDREGEAIAYHVQEVLTESGSTKFARIVFHEITKEAVENSIEHPGKVDANLVDAQVARRVLDRLVGYKLSPLLWKKVRRGLSAGRVQSVAVRLVVEREREIEAFKAEEYWEIYCDLVKKGNKKDKFTVALIKIGDKKAVIDNTKLAKKVTDDLEKADYKVLDVRRKEVNKNPYPPFTTSTMTQAAARIIRWSAKKTMSVAQKLYEEGLITYHRTDSMSIASTAIDNTRNFIATTYGANYVPKEKRFYKTKAKVAQEAHEAIRPTNVTLVPGSKDWDLSGQFANDAAKLYELIWKRSVACQMASSVYDETVIEVLAKNVSDYTLRVSGQVIKFDGWKKIYGESALNGEVKLPDVEKDDDLDLVKIDSQQKFTQPPARYNEASLIKTLEKLGIGRPSTYAPTISTIQTRNYVEKDDNKFSPTPVGIAVNDFLAVNFPKIMEYSFTAKMEGSLDDIANGEVKWTGVIGSFWDDFEPKLDKATDTAKRVKIEVEKTGKKCPSCKDGELVIRIGRFGKFISCSNFPDCKHTDKFVEKIEMKCLECGKGDIVVKRTRKGRKFYGCSRYPDCEWASWRKPSKEASE